MASRRYTREFKISAIKLVREQGYSVPEAARSLGIDPSNVRGWLKTLGNEAGPPLKGEAALRAEVQRLRKENARLHMEQDILKKAAAFFARERS